MHSLETTLQQWLTGTDHIGVQSSLALISMEYSAAYVVSTAHQHETRVQAKVAIVDCAEITDINLLVARFHPANSAIRDGMFARSDAGQRPSAQFTATLMQLARCRTKAVFFLIVSLHIVGWNRILGDHCQLQNISASQAVFPAKSPAVFWPKP